MPSRACPICLCLVGFRFEIGGNVQLEYFIMNGGDRNMLFQLLIGHGNALRSCVLFFRFLFQALG
jgi:hypothetical protein